LLAATFFVPPLLAWRLLPLGGVATAGLFLIAVAPGAPLMTRGVAKKGFDMQIAASYQVWGALLTPLLVPLLVAFGGWVPDGGAGVALPAIACGANVSHRQRQPACRTCALAGRPANPRPATGAGYCSLRTRGCPGDGTLCEVCGAKYGELDRSSTDNSPHGKGEKLS
jgi:hypothetical protein